MRRNLIPALLFSGVAALGMAACDADWYGYDEEGVMEDEGVFEEDEGVLQEDEGVIEEDQGVFDEQEELGEDEGIYE